MEDIDLGDRRGLIDLIYGVSTTSQASISGSVPSNLAVNMNFYVRSGFRKQKDIAVLKQPQKGEVSDTPSASSNTLTPLTDHTVTKKPKKEKSNVVCSFSTAVMLFLLAAAAVFLCGFAAYWLTRQQFEMKMAALKYVPQPRRNLSQQSKEADMYEEEPPMDGPTVDELRLPRNLEPIWYNLTLKTYLPGVSAIANEKNLTTDGNIMIKLRALSATDEITLNAKDLTFPLDFTKARILTDEVVVPAEDQSPEELTNIMTNMVNMTTTTAAPATQPALQMHQAKVKRILYNATLEKVVLFLDNVLLSREEVIVQLPFSGRITENSDGLHHTTYRTRAGDKKVLSFTNLRPGSTRSIYPSLDEPQFKAPLSLTIIHPKGTVARASAMEKLDSLPTSEPLWDRTSFEATPTLSTSHTGFIVSDFENKEGATNIGMKVRIYSRPEAVNSTTFALDTAVKALDLLQEYFGVPLKGDKQDIFAIPTLDDTSISGQGIMFMPEEDLLLDPSTNTAEQRVKIARAVTRALTRQWFGNLVAPSDWHALWLNEAFAKYMEYFLLDKIFAGDVDAKSYQTGDSLEQVLVDDARSSSHPLSLNIETPAEAEEILDKVTAEKGGAVLRMIRAVVGEETFQKGVQNFLTTHANGTANYTDFWDALDNAIGGKLNAWDGNKLKTADFAEKWILQMGYPIIDVYRLDARTVELTQRRFKLDHLTPERAKYRNALYWYKWDVPIFYEINGAKEDMTWLHEAVRLPLNLSDTLLINPESLGYYRVNYDEQGWIAIADLLQKDHQRAFAVISYLPKETDYLPWTVALRGLRNLYNRLSKTELEPKAKEFVQEKTAQLFTSLDLDNLSSPDDSKFLESQVRKDLAMLYCEMSPEECTKKLVAQFDTNFMTPCKDSEIASDCSKVPSFIRSLVYCAGVSEGGPKEYGQIRKFSINEVDSAEKRRLLEALSCSKDPRALRRLLYDSLHTGTSPVLKSDVQGIVESMNNQVVGKEIVSDFVLDNWRDLNDRFALDKATLSNILGSAIRLNSERDVKQFERFLTDHKSTTLGLRVLKLQLEIARNQVQWLKTNKKTMKNLLSSRRSEKEL
ncbi:peptidase family M1 [Ancylostoma caninum]|uniref:Peptidase family M1 n=1 Tax=Ancylostoma caninum TaxID=29170 RepID=A0A368H647_ANCCA|nr:peptidase family M1 [Ancylostoma caninum]